MELLFPTSFGGIADWRSRNGVPADEARKRFVQFAILESIGSVPDLANSISFKGGNALRFAYGSRRSTIDLDFTADETVPDNDVQIRSRLDRALRFATSRYQVKARCQRVKRKPANMGRPRPTYDITVAYLLPGDRLYKNYEELAVIPTIIELEISLNELVCEAFLRRLYPGGNEISVCSLEDITAEKLRALLQQPIRDRSRPQDVFDIASIVGRDHGSLDLSKVAQFLKQKSEAREIHPRKSGFDDEVRRRASIGYDVEIGTDTPGFIRFEEAWKVVIELVSRLYIPE